MVEGSNVAFSAGHGMAEAQSTSENTPNVYGGDNDVTARWMAIAPQLQRSCQLTMLLPYMTQIYFFADNNKPNCCADLSVCIAQWC